MHGETNPRALKRSIVLLACIPSVDCIVNQLANGFQLHIGSVSILQGFRAILLLCFAVFVLSRITKRSDTILKIPPPAIGGFILLLLLVSRQWLISGSGGIEGYAAYAQIAYWLLLWTTVSLSCVEPAEAMLLLYGLACGAILTALSVVLGLAFGGLNFYEDDLVSSSAGWFNTAKAITGILVCGIAVILYLGCGRRRSWVYGILAAFCLAAAALTYARAGAIALLVVVLWLTLWRARTGSFVQWRALKWFLGLVVVIVLAAPMVIHPQMLFARWSDLSKGEDAGSGRIGLWHIAVDSYTAAPLSVQLLGSGFESMSDLLFRESGEDVKHTHNDAFDMLLIGGVAGIVWHMSFFWLWGRRIARFSPWSLEGAALMAVFINYVCHSELTGQLWGTDVMNYYVTALTAFTVLASRSRAPSEARSTASFAAQKTTARSFSGEVEHA